MRSQPTRNAEEVSRFTVLYADPHGTVKRRQFREGVLSVSFHIAILHDAEDRRCVTTCRGSGLLPNELYKEMLRCHSAKDLYWHEGSEVYLGRYLIRIETILQLHCVPYDVTELHTATDRAASPTPTRTRLQAEERTLPSPPRRAIQQLTDVLQQNYAHLL